MKTELATTSNNQVSTQVGDTELIGYLDNLGLTKKLTEGEKSTYLQIAKAFGLNPFKRELHVSKYGDTMSIITGYEVYIKRAERSGQLDGWSATTSGSVEGGDLKATVTIYRKDRSHPFIWEALYTECVQKTREGKPTQFWQKASFMTKKVAISQAFRLCFSDELAGMPYTADEMPSDIPETVDTHHEELTVVQLDYEAELRECGSVDELKEKYKKMPKEKQVEFKDLVADMKASFTKTEQAA
jgi:hypothetical protein